MTYSSNFKEPKPLRSDQEFLPAALSILETPASPVRIALIWLVGLLVIFTIGWSYFGRIDIVATAQGKIQPTGRVKTIQPLDGGKVIALNAENGQHVEAGSILVELDPSELLADETASSVALAGYRAEQMRRAKSIAAAETRNLNTLPVIAWPQAIPIVTRMREDRILKGDIGQLAIIVKSFDAQIAQRRTEERRLHDTIAAQGSLIVTLKERVSMRSGLVSKGASTRASLIDALETLQAQETAHATQKGQLLEAQAAVSVLMQEREKSFESFVAENSQKLGEAERQIDDFEQRVAKSHAKTGHMTLVSPISGTVFGLSVTTLGQVVTAGEEIMRIVPDGSDLEIECYVQNKDIGFVQPGQAAIVKIESFPFTRYGSLDARVTRVAHDAIPEPDAQSVEANAAKTLKANYFGGAQRTQNLVFPVTLLPGQKAMNVDGASIPLSPGMAVTVEVKTGRRRIIDYLFSPLAETASKALRER